MPPLPQKWPAMGPSDYQRYQIQFLQSTNNDPTASIPAQVCAPMIAASGLEKHILKQVWEIADARKIGALAWPEFVVGMYLADVIKTRGVQCPEMMPPMPFPPFDQNAAGLLTNIAPSISMAPAAAAAAAPPPPPQQQQQHSKCSLAFKHLSRNKIRLTSSLVRSFATSSIPSRRRRVLRLIALTATRRSPFVVRNSISLPFQTPSDNSRKRN